MPWEGSVGGDLRYLESDDSVLSKEIHELVYEKYKGHRSAKGLLFGRKNTRSYKGVVLAHGLSLSSERLSILAKRLAVYGFLVYSIDLPEHGASQDQYTMGRASQIILDAVSFLRTQGVQSVAVIGHSLGAVAALFASFGYTETIEYGLFELSKQFSKLLDQKYRIIDILMKKEKHLRESPEGMAKFEMLVASQVNHIDDEIEQIYEDMMNMIITALQTIYQEHGEISCFVLLSMAKRLYDSHPGLGTLALLPHGTLKPIIESLSKSKFDKDSRYKHHAKWGAIHTDDVHRFIRYFVNMDQPDDYMKLIEHLASLQLHDPRSATFREYLEVIRNRPKLVAYGASKKFGGDWIVRGFIGLRLQSPTVKGLEKFYRCFGNVQIFQGDYRHDNSSVEEAELASEIKNSVVNRALTERIIRFLHAHM